MDNHDMRNPSSIRRQRGVGLIEVLVSLLVMAIGMLGLAALQSLAMRNSQSSLDRTQAVYQIYSILDAMRANSNSLAAYRIAKTCAPPAAGAIPQVVPAQAEAGGGAATRAFLRMV